MEHTCNTHCQITVRPAAAVYQKRVLDFNETLAWYMTRVRLKKQAALKAKYIWYYHLLLQCTLMFWHTSLSFMVIFSLSSIGWFCRVYLPKDSFRFPQQNTAMVYNTCQVKGIRPLWWPLVLLCLGGTRLTVITHCTANADAQNPNMSTRSCLQITWYRTKDSSSIVLLSSAQWSSKMPDHSHDYG